jgi:hypothetical protein
MELKLAHKKRSGPMQKLKMEALLERSKSQNFLSHFEFQKPKETLYEGRSGERQVVITSKVSKTKEVRGVDSCSGRKWQGGLL